MLSSAPGPVRRSPVARPGAVQTAVMQPRLAETPGWSPSPTSPVLDPNEAGGLRGIAFAAGLAMIFARFAILPELIVTALHVDLYVLYLIGPPAIIGVLLTGGVQRTYRGLPAKLWTGFFIWMALAVPTSSWMGASASENVWLLPNRFHLPLCAGRFGGVVERRAADFLHDRSGWGGEPSYGALPRQAGYQRTASAGSRV